MRLFVELLVAFDLRCWVRGPRRLDPVENRTSGLVFERGLVCAAAGAQSLGQSYASERRLIGCADLVPQSRSLEPEPLPGGRVPLGETHSALSKRRAGYQCLALESSGHAPQVVRG